MPADPSIPSKACTKCGPPEQPLSEFNRSRAAKDGRRSWLDLRITVQAIPNAKGAGNAD